MRGFDSSHTCRLLSNFYIVCFGFRQESPWVWACRTGRGCVKVAKDSPVQDGDDMSNPTLVGCKLTCNPDAMLWPKPRDFAFLSRTLINFQLADMRVTRISAPTPQVPPSALKLDYTCVMRQKQSIETGIFSRSRL